MANRRKLKRGSDRPAKNLYSAIRRKMVKNAHQLIALCFVTCMATLFFVDYQQPDLPANLRSSESSLAVEISYEAMDPPLSQHAPAVEIPNHFNFLANNDEKVKKTPIFWHLPRSGGKTMCKVLGSCRGMVLAGSWTGTSEGNLTIVHENDMKQVTVDLETKQGRVKAKEEGLTKIDHHLVVLSKNILETSEIFGISVKGELWTWFRHPVERQISYYFFLQTLPEGHHLYIPAVRAQSLAEWTISPSHTPNAMLASLLGEPIDQIAWTEEDLDLAKNLLRRKAKIGLLDQKAESMRRFSFQRDSSSDRECEERLLHYGWNTKGSYPQVGKKTLAYKLLMQSNALDMKLFEYALYLFTEQRSLFG